MGVISSTEERLQFVQALRIAAEAGWTDAKIALELVVSSAELKAMLSGHLPPSQKHLDRLNHLLQSRPPKRLVPAPSRPLVTPPAFTPTRESSNGEPALVVEEVSTRRATTDEEEATMENTLHAPAMETDVPQVVLNGHSKAKHQDPKDRFRMLSKAESQALRQSMQRTLSNQFDNSAAGMARALGVSGSGMRKILSKKNGIISVLTKLRFEALVGKANGARQPESNGAPAHGRAKQKRRKTVLKGRRSKVPAVWRLRDRLPPKAEAAPSRAMEGEFDLYALAGRALIAGKTDQAHLLSMIARITDTVPLEEVGQALKALLPSSLRRSEKNGA